GRARARGARAWCPLRRRLARHVHPRQMRHGDLAVRFRRLVVVRTRAAYQDTVRGSVVSVAATGLVVALVCAVVIGLSGQTRLTQQRIDDRIESASSRLIRLRDVDGGAGLDTAAVESLQKVEQLAWVVGFTPTRDVGNQVFGGDVFSTPAVGVEGDIDRLYPGASHHLGHEADRAIAGDGALASLGMPTGRGGVYFEDGASLSIVGPAHAAHDPERQDRLVVYRAHPDSGLSSILVL